MKRWIPSFPRALRDELGDSLQVVRFLRWPFWVAWGLVVALALAGLFPGRWALPAEALLFLLVGLAGVFVSKVARRLRNWEWVQYAHGPETVPYLPQTLALLFLPVSFLLMAALFHQIALRFPNTLPAATPLSALALALDNSLHSAVFLDFFETFHLRLSPEPDDWIGASLLLATRFLLTLAFLRVVGAVVYAAYNRARGLGRGEDTLFKLKSALEAGDLRGVQQLAGQVGLSLRAAVDSLAERIHTQEDGHEEAWETLILMREFSQPYLHSRVAAATGEEHRWLGDLEERLRQATPTAYQTPSAIRRWPLILLIALVAGLTIGSILRPAVSLLAFPLLGWLLLAPRRWLNRLLRWGAIGPIEPGHMPRTRLLWSLAVLPAVVISGAALVLTVAGWRPETFSLHPGTQVSWAAAVGFVFQNLLHTQLFFDAFELLGQPLTQVQPTGVLGYSLTFAQHLVFDISIIGLVSSFLIIWGNRLFRGFEVTPHAEQNLSEEAEECEAHAPLMVRFYYDQIKKFFLDTIAQQKGTEFVAALAASGFYAQHQETQPVGGPLDPDRAQRHFEQGVLLRTQGLLVEAEGELRQAAGLYLQLVALGQENHEPALAGAWQNLAVTLAQRGDRPAAEAIYRRAVELLRKRKARGAADAGELLSSALTAQAMFLRDGGQFALALEASTEALALARALVPPEALDARTALTLAAFTHASVLQCLRRYAEADPLYQEGFNLADGVMTETQRTGGTPDPWLVLTAVGSMNNVALAARALGQLDDAERWLRQGVGLLAEFVRHGVTEFAEPLLQYTINLSGVLSERDKMGEADVVLSDAVAGIAALVRKGHAHLRRVEALGRAQRSFVLLALDPQTAEQEARAAAELLERLVEKEGFADLRPTLALARRQVGNSLLMMQRHADAEPWLQKAMNDFSALLAAGYSGLQGEAAFTCDSLGMALLARQAAGEAEALLRKGLGWLDELATAGEPVQHLQAQLKGHLGELLATQEKAEAALPLLHEAHAILDGLVQSGRQELRDSAASVVFSLAFALHKSGQTAEARQTLETCWAGLRQLTREGFTQNLGLLAMGYVVALRAGLLDQAQVEEAGKDLQTLVAEVRGRGLAIPPYATQKVEEFVKEAGV